MSQESQPQELWLVSFASNAPDLFSVVQAHRSREAALKSAEAIIIYHIETDCESELEEGVDEEGITVADAIEKVRQQFAEAKEESVFVRTSLNTDRLHLEWQVEISKDFL